MSSEDVTIGPDGDIVIRKGSRTAELLHLLAKMPLHPEITSGADPRMRPPVVRCKECSKLVGHYEGQTLVFEAPVSVSGSPTGAFRNAIQPEVAKLSRVELEAEYQRVNRVRWAALRRAEEYCKQCEGLHAALDIQEKNGTSAVLLHKELETERFRSAGLQARLKQVQGSLEEVKKQLQNTTEDRNQWRLDESKVAKEKQEFEDRLSQYNLALTGAHANAEQWKERAEKAEKKAEEPSRWESAVRNMVTFLVGPAAPFDLPQVVEMVRRLAQCDANGDPIPGSERMFVSSKEAQEIKAHWQTLVRALRKECKLNGYWHLPSCEVIDAALRATGIGGDE